MIASGLVMQQKNVFEWHAHFVCFQCTIVKFVQNLGRRVDKRTRHHTLLLSFIPLNIWAYFFLLFFLLHAFC